MWDKNIILYIVIIWGIIEQINGIKSRISSKDVFNKDKNSLILINLGIVAGYTVSFHIYFTRQFGIIFKNPIYLMLTGIIIIILGLIVRVSAILILKKQFTYSVTILSDHKLVEEGLYKIIRHPSYSGSLLILLGSGVAMNNWICISVLAVINFIVTGYRIHIEEKALLENFGTKYSDYMKRTKRLIPFIY